MNAEHDSSPQPNDDRLLAEMLSPLKGLEPPLETRIANRQAISTALSSFPAINQQRNLPWWRRSILIPVPLAAALVLLLAVMGYANVRSWRAPPAAVVAAPSHRAAQAASKTSTAQAPNISHYQSDIYLCGVGLLSSESYYAVKE